MDTSLVLAGRISVECIDTGDKLSSMAGEREPLRFEEREPPTSPTSCTTTPSTRFFLPCVGVPGAFSSLLPLGRLEEPLTLSLAGCVRDRCTFARGPPAAVSLPFLRRGDSTISPSSTVGRDAVDRWKRESTEDEEPEANRFELCFDSSDIDDCLRLVLRAFGDGLASSERGDKLSGVRSSLDSEYSSSEEDGGDLFAISTDRES